MSLLLNQPLKLCFQKPVLVRSSPLLSNGFSSSSLQTPPCTIVDANPCGGDLGKLVILNASELCITVLEKKVPIELVYHGLNGEIVTLGSSHGWVATLKDDGILRLQDDLNPFTSDTDPKRISLPPLVTLPQCQTKIVSNVAMSSPSPEDEDCVVAVKFLGPQLSFCRPSQSNSEWTNIRIQNPCFFSSPVMFSKKHDMFRIPGSGGHLIGSWDLGKHNQKPKFQRLRLQNLPELTKTKRKIMDSCCTSEHLVESTTTGETFLVKLYKKTTRITKGIAKMKTKALMVFNAVYTKDIGDVNIFLSKSEPFCVPASSFGMIPNRVIVYDVDEICSIHLADSFINSRILPTGFSASYHIPPQNIDL